MTNVPPYKSYFCSEPLNADQRAFFLAWEYRWKQGDPLEVEGQISYLFLHAYKVLQLSCQAALSELARLRECYRHEAHFANYCGMWMADLHVQEGDFESALRVYPAPAADGRSGGGTAHILNLKLQMGQRLAGRDLLTLPRCRFEKVGLTGPKVTAWGRDHLSELSEYMDIVVTAYEAHHQIDLLRDWLKDTHTTPFSLLGGTQFRRELRDLTYYHFGHNPRVLKFAEQFAEEAENTVREELGLPRIGEGWIAETNLFYEIKAAFPDLKVEHHGRPSWLGNQHLDVYLPEVSVGVEYQGAQHDGPVSFFGGEEGFKKNQERDARKRKLCKRHGVTLVEVRPGYVLQSIVEQIRLAQNEGS